MNEDKRLEEILQQSVEGEYIGPDPQNRAQLLAEEHVDWFLRALRPLLVDHFVHGYKHGREDAE